MENKLLIAKSEPLWNTDNRVIYFIGSLIILLFALPLFGLNSFYLHLLIMIFMHAVMAQSWNVIAGFSGQISLGHGAFFGIGAYATSFFYIEYGISPWLSMPFGILVSGIFAILIGIPMLRLSGHYFAIATLLIGISFQVVFQRWDLVGAASGLWVPMTSEDSWAALQFHSSKVSYYYIFLVFFIVTFFIVWLLSRSKLGYRLRAVRDDPQAALSLCINVSNYKIIAYVISAMIMAPINLHDTPHDVCHAKCSTLSLSANLTSNGFEKFCPKKWDVPICNALPSGIIDSMVVVYSAPTNFSFSLFFPVVTGMANSSSTVFL